MSRGHFLRLSLVVDKNLKNKYDQMLHRHVCMYILRSIIHFVYTSKSTCRSASFPPEYILMYIHMYICVQCYLTLADICWGDSP